MSESLKQQGGAFCCAVILSFVKLTNDFAVLLIKENSREIKEIKEIILQVKRNCSIWPFDNGFISQVGICHLVLPEQSVSAAAAALGDTEQQQMETLQAAAGLGS